MDGKARERLNRKVIKMATKQKNMVGIVVMVLLIPLLILSIYYLMPKRLPKGVIQTTGIIGAVEVNLSSKITERIKEIKFKEGDYVKEGEIAIILDSEKRRAEYEESEANLDVAEATLLSTKAEIEKSKVKIEDTNRDLNRISSLLEEKLVSQNDKDKAQTNYDLARLELNRVEAQEVLSNANIRQAQAALNLAKINLEDTVIKSTVSGVVTLRAFEPGEMVSSGAAILTIVDTKNIWARVDIEETVVAKIKLGDEARVQVDALPVGTLPARGQEEFEGKIVEINTEGEFATQRDVKRGRQDIKTFRIKVKIDDLKGVLKPGMSVTVTFKE